MTTHPEEPALAKPRVGQTTESGVAPSASHGATREALILPFVFLTVALLGGLRVGVDGGLRFLPPPLISLVLGLFLVSVLVRGQVLSPTALMSDRRDGLENAGGAAVLVALFAASAQLFNCLLPEAGFLHFLFSAFFAALIWNTGAARPEANRLLRSLLVVFVWSFVMKHVLLAAFYAPQGGLTKRVLSLLLEGVSLGTLAHEPAAPLTGYVAFFTVMLYMAGLVLLPRPAPSTVLAVRSGD